MQNKRSFGRPILGVLVASGSGLGKQDVVCLCSTKGVTETPVLCAFSVDHAIPDLQSHDCGRWLRNGLTGLGPKRPVFDLRNFCPSSHRPIIVWTPSRKLSLERCSSMAYLIACSYQKEHDHSDSDAGLVLCRVRSEVAKSLCPHKPKCSVLQSERGVWLQISPRSRLSAFLVRSTARRNICSPQCFHVLLKRTSIAILTGIHGPPARIGGS